MLVRGERREFHWQLALAAGPLLGYLLAFLITRPIQFPDESGIIQNARFLAGTSAQSELWYRPGYSLLLVPVVRLTDDLGITMTVVHVVNLILAYLTAFGLYRLGRLLRPDASTPQVAVAVGLASVYPAYLFFAAFALADNLLIVAVVWTTIAVARALTRSSQRALVVSAVAVSSSVAIHGRAIPLVLAFVAMLGIEWRRTSDRRYVITAIATLLGAAIVYWASGLVSDFNTLSVLSDGARQDAGSIISANLGWRPLLVLPFTVLGQVLYLSAASFGLAVLGAGLLSNAVVSRDTGVRVAASYTLLVMVFTLFLSALFTNQGVGDLALYGRYLEVGSVVVLFAGALTFVIELPSWYGRVLPPVLLVGACVLVGIRGSDAFVGRLQVLNVTGAKAAIDLSGRLDPVAIALFSAFGIFVLSQLRKADLRLPVVGLVVLFVLSAGLAMQQAREFLDVVEERNRLSSSFEQAVPASCVVLDQTETFGFWQGENYRLHNPDLDFPQWRSGESTAPPCDDLVVSSSRDVGRALPGWRPVAVEYERPFWLWASPTVYERHFVGQEITPPPGETLYGLRASVEIVDVVPPATPADDYVVTVRVENTSGDTFVPLSNLSSFEGAVRVGLEWRVPESPGERIHEPVRGDLDELLRPGESAEVEIELSTDLGDLVITTGPWILRAEVVQEGVAWAGDSAAGDESVLVR